MGVSQIASRAAPAVLRPVARAAARPAPALLRAALFGAGVLLPLITLETEAGRGASGLLTDRITPVDVVTLLAVTTLVWRDGLRVTAAGLVYLYALTVSLCIGAIAGQSGEEVVAIVTAYVAMLMAFQYWMLGYAVGRSAPLVRALVLGVMAGVAWELAIVAHDYLTGSPWFMDKMSGRVRGTFKKSGQLGAFGFSVAGILLTMGWAVFDRVRERRLAVLMGAAGIFMVVAASRRSAMIALGVWLLLFLVAGARHAGSRSYRLALASFAAIVVTVILFAEQLASSFLGARLAVAFTSVSEGNSFTEMQYAEAMAHVTTWFPLGVGIGRWAIMTGEHELHNGHLALVVETGVFGLLAFYALASGPLRRNWRSIMRGRAAAVPTLVATFLLAGAVMMVHNRLHRDRAFMLFLGLSAGLSTTVLRGGRSAAGPAAADPGPSPTIVPHPPAMRTPVARTR